MASSSYGLTQRYTADLVSGYYNCDADGSVREGTHVHASFNVLYI